MIKNIVNIGKELTLSNNDMYIAETIGILHDVGRFTQMKNYKTFMDYETKDHADLGIEVIDRKNLLEHTEAEEKNIILKAIKYHNKFKIPDYEDEKVLLFSKLIRDADKLDILNAHTKYYEKRQYCKDDKLEVFPDEDYYNEDIVYDILNNRNARPGSFKTLNDIKLLRLSWIFDINFKPSIKLIKENRYVERTIKVLPNDNRIQKVKIHLLNYIDERV